MKVIVTGLDGKDHDVEATPNWTVMEIVRDSGLPMRAECGGSCACATCHVYVDPAWADKVEPQSQDERDILDVAFEVKPTSRLSCQFTFKPELDGMRVTLTKDSAS